MTSRPVVYVDTSALVALLIDEPESPALLEWLDHTPATLVSSDLLETELLQRAVDRTVAAGDLVRPLAIREGLDQSDVTSVLDGVALAALDRAVYRSAGFLPMPNLRTLDALHLEAAMRLDASAVLTYDRRLGEAARSAGLDVIAPSA